MSLFDEKELEQYNEEKLQKMEKELQKMRKELEALRQNADSCEIKKPINNGYHVVCPYKADCLGKRKNADFSNQSGGDSDVPAKAKISVKMH